MGIVPWSVITARTFPVPVPVPVSKPVTGSPHRTVIPDRRIASTNMAPISGSREAIGAGPRSTTVTATSQAQSASASSSPM